MSTSASPLAHLPRPVGAAAPLLTAVGAAGLAVAITALWHGMRVVMGVGGSCASGGPYDVAAPCPAGSIALVAPSIPLIFVFGAIFAVGAEQLCRGGAFLAIAAWPALFLSLAWNFFQHGVAPVGGGGPVGGWLLCGALFALMGAPVLAALPRVARGLDAARRRAVLAIAVGGALAGVAGGAALASALT
jgi:hypothetical protein